MEEFKANCLTIDFELFVTAPCTSYDKIDCRTLIEHVCECNGTLNLPLKKLSVDFVFFLSIRYVDYVHIPCLDNKTVKKKTVQ